MYYTIDIFVGETVAGYHTGLIKKLII